MAVSALYLGPLGRLMRLPVPLGGFDAPPVEYGASHVPLSGKRTKDVFAYRREYSISMDGYSPRALSWVEMLLTGAVTGPYYLIDTRRTNRLSRRVSSSSSSPFAGSGVASAWTATVPPVPTATTTLLLPDGVAAPVINTPAPSFGLTWSPTGAATLTDALPTAVVPGEVVCVSVYLPSTLHLTLELVPYSSALVAGAAITGSTVIASTPNRMYLRYTVPGSGVAAVAPQLRASQSGAYVSLAWQLEAIVSVASLPSAWVLGMGTPRVLVDAVDEHAEYLGQYVTPSMTLYEV